MSRLRQEQKAVRDDEQGHDVSPSRGLLADNCRAAAAGATFPIEYAACAGWRGGGSIGGGRRGFRHEPILQTPVGGVRNRLAGGGRGGRKGAGGRQVPV